MCHFFVYSYLVPDETCTAAEIVHMIMYILSIIFMMRKKGFSSINLELKKKKKL